MREQFAALVVVVAVAFSAVVVVASPVAAVAGFGDVAEADFFGEAVAWMVAEDLTTGTGPGCFSPGDDASRAQSATFIHRLAGEPFLGRDGSDIFVDVAAGSFYDAAVGWMADTGITTGTTSTTFQPQRPVTRAEFATFVWRYAGSPAAAPASSTFADVEAGSFYDTAVGWMAAEGITTGTTATTFAPARPVTRGEIATFLWRYGGEPAASTTPTGAVCSRTGEREPSPPSTALGLLGELRVSAESRDGYDRDLFDHWSDLDGDGCDTRQEVLAEESLDPVTTSDGCRVTAGQWRSLFDDIAVSNPSSLDIDHLVPLAEAWDSGASRWDETTRERFANDQTDPRALIAVTASSNRSKSDRDPAGWLPPDSTYLCTYASDWVAIKTRWQLHIDTAEKTALVGILVSCPSVFVSVDVAVIGTETTPTTTTTTTPPSTCHPAYSPCLPNLPGDALNCGDLSPDQKPVTVLVLGVDPYNLDGNNDGIGCS